MKLIALEEAFWYDKLSTDGTPDALVPVKPEVIAGWRRRPPDFTKYRLPDVDKHGIDMQVLSLTASGLQMQPDHTPRAFLAASLAYNLRDGIAEKITCPVFVGRGESDEFFRGQPEELMQYLTAPATLAGPQPQPASSRP